MEAINTWDYFDKCDKDKHGDSKAQCNICGGIFCYQSTIHNLKKHLLKQHDILVPKKKKNVREKSELEKSGIGMGRVNRSLLWDFFERTNPEDRRATCKGCGKTLSYKSTTGNLKTHMKNFHPEELSRLLLNKSLVSDDEEEYEEIEEDASDHSSVEGAKPGGVLWSYFERSGRRARCAVCRASVAPRPRALSQHLQAHHPKLLPSAEESEQEQEEEGDHYTEVIYLEDGPKSEERGRAKRRRTSYTEQPKHRKSSPPKETETPKKNQEDEEIESFGAYVICLLKSLPKDVCSATQRDIVNIIMSAKLQKPANQVVVTPIVKNAQHTVQPSRNFVVIQNTVDKETADSSQNAVSYTVVGDDQKYVSNEELPVVNGDKDVVI